MDVGYLVGDFDLLNVGHLDLIAQVRERCRSIVVGVLSDDDVLAVTGRAPLIPEGERLALVRALRGVDDALLHPGATGGPTEPHVTTFVAEGWCVQRGSDVVLSPRRSTASALLLTALPAATAADAA